MDKSVFDKLVCALDATHGTMFHHQRSAAKLAGVTQSVVRKDVTPRACFGPRGLRDGRSTLIAKR
jgi:hypothetical protein